MSKNIKELRNIPFKKLTFYDPSLFKFEHLNILIVYIKNI